MASDLRKTPVFDWEKGEFEIDAQNAVRTVTGGDAVKQVIIKAASTVRGVHEIYEDLEDPDYNHKYGSDVKQIAITSGLSEAAKLSEIKRAIKEALIYDPWITDVTGINIYTVDGVTYADYTVSTIYDIQSFEGVVINE